MKTRKLLALLLVLPLLTWCQKPAQEPVDDNNNQEQGQGQGQGTVDPETNEDPYADAAPELQNGASLLVTNEMVQAFLEKVKSSAGQSAVFTSQRSRVRAPTSPPNKSPPVRWAFV